MEKNIAIGIEGLVGSGKTSICEELLQVIPNTVLIHGGNLYRAIVYAIINKKNINSIEELGKITKKINIKQIMEKFNINLKVKDNQTVVCIKDKEISNEELQSAKISLAVSTTANVADNTELYTYIHDMIQKMQQKYNLIISGRAIMEIYPEVDEHILVTADLEERVKRKYNQYQGKISKEEVRENILKRDKLQEDTGFYKKYDKTKIIDVTECKSTKESAEKILEHFGEWADKYITVKA